MPTHQYALMAPFAWPALQMLTVDPKKGATVDMYNSYRRTTAPRFSRNHPSATKVIVSAGGDSSFLTCAHLRSVFVHRDLFSTMDEVISLAAKVVRLVPSLNRLVLMNYPRRGDHFTNEHVRQLLAVVRRAKARGVRTVKLWLPSHVDPTPFLDPHGWTRVFVRCF